MIHKQLDGQADILDPLRLVNKDRRGAPHDPLQVFQFVPGYQRLCIEIIAVKDDGVGNFLQELPNQRGFACLPWSIENLGCARLSQVIVHLLGNRTLKHLHPLKVFLKWNTLEYINFHKLVKSQIGLIGKNISRLAPQFCRKNLTGGLERQAGY